MFKIGDKVIFNEKAKKDLRMLKIDFERIFIIEDKIDDEILCLNETYGIYMYNTIHKSWIKKANSHLIKERLGVK